MKVKKSMKRASACFAVFFFVLSIPFAQAIFYEDQIKWSGMVGAIVPGTVFGGPSVVAGIKSPALSWTARKGSAKVRLDKDYIRFEVKGLVPAAQFNPPRAGVVIGAVSAPNAMVFGTLVCNADKAGATTYDTPAVPLTRQGDAKFSGIVSPSLPSTCPSAAFLIRFSGGGDLDGRWLAAGVSRTP